MQIDLKTVAIEPKRKAFDHLVRRFGDKVASRYQEGSYDIQAVENLHYRPTWAPEQTLYDPTISKVVMEDWHAFKDPRQFYYSSYVLARARQQEAAEGAFALVESRALHATIPEDLRTAILDLLVPLRHAAWGANQNNVLIAGYGFGVTFTQPCLYHGMDNLAVAQYLSRIGLLLGGTEALAAGKTRKWVDSVVKIAAGESESNAATISGWVSEWSDRAMAALLPPVEQAIGRDADAVLGQVLSDLNARLAKAGVKA